MTIALIASTRHAIAEPFAGGLERHTHALATGLRERGHKVTVFASAESDAALGVEPILARASRLDFSPDARRDVSMLAEPFMQEHHAYLRLMLRLQERPGFDVVHNNSLHYLPVAMAPALPGMCVTTLHTPPVPWLESAVACAAASGAAASGATASGATASGATASGATASNVKFVSVSKSNARRWRAHLPRCRVIPNGVDPKRWAFAPAGDPGVAAWTGRIVPEKGVHLAVEAAHRAGLRIRLAGPVHDEAYFEAEVRPRLRATDEYAGHLTHGALARLVGGAGVFLSTPCWDEPYGLVVPEALSCGTPVAAFRRGAVPELLTRRVGRLAPPGDTRALAEAAREARTLDRRACREHVAARHTLGVMVERYEALYASLVGNARGDEQAAPTPAPERV